MITFEIFAFLRNISYTIAALLTARLSRLSMQLCLNRSLWCSRDTRRFFFFLERVLFFFLLFRTIIFLFNQGITIIH